MRHFHSSVTPAVIQQDAHRALESSLDWKPFHDSVSVADLIDVFLLMAVHNASLFATVSRFFAFCHETASQAVKANLPTMDRLVSGLGQSLYDVAQFSRQDRRRKWLLAIDTHNVAYYGKNRNTYVVGGQKKQGTSWFHCYATAVLLHKHRRYTIALCPVAKHTRTDEIVQTLLEQITEKGLKIQGVALDSGFDSGETILLLQEKGLAYVVPLRRKGKTRNARNRCFEGKHRLIRWVEWKTDKSRRLVKTRTLLWNQGPRTMVFAFQSWSGMRARNIHEKATRMRRLYRQRFGIETSYRQKNQAQARTTSRNPVYRMLLEGIGYIIRQLWVVLTEQIARGSHAGPNAWIASLTMQRMLEWLVHELEALHPEDYSIPNDTDTSANGSR
jgi:hypothetical protein